MSELNAEPAPTQPLSNLYPANTSKTAKIQKNVWQCKKNHTDPILQLHLRGKKQIEKLRDKIIRKEKKEQGSK